MGALADGLAPGVGRPRRPTELDDFVYLHRAYVLERRSARCIAADLGCSAKTVLDTLRRNGIAIRANGSKS